MSQTWWYYPFRRTFTLGFYSLILSGNFANSNIRISWSHLPGELDYLQHSPPFLYSVYHLVCDNPLLILGINVAVDIINKLTADESCTEIVFHPTFCF